MYIVGKGLWDKQINMRKHRIKFKCIFRSLVVIIQKKKKKHLSQDLMKHEKDLLVDVTMDYDSK